MSNENSTRLENIEGHIWYNGEIIKSQDAKVHMLTHSLHYAGGVFEGIKSFNGKVFSLEKHIARLFKSAQEMRLEINFSQNEVITATKKVVRLNNLSDSYIRPFVWRSTEALAVLPCKPIFHILVGTWEPRRKVKLDPLKVNISKWIKPSPEMNPIQCKASSYYAMLSRIGLEAIEAGYDDSIMLDINKYIAECTTSNIFFIKENQLFTPTTDNCLNGITRQTVIEIAAQNNIEVHQRNIILEDIPNFDAAFVTGTAAGLKPIGQVDYLDNTIIFKDSDLFAFLKAGYEKLTRE
jgi:branched-chain amino acid aminotransferase